MRLAFFLIFICASAAGSRTVWNGVYSKEQANRGQKIYNSQCARCHGEALLGGEASPPLVDQDFLDKWNGKTVADLVELTRKSMPSDGPGKLSRKQCTDLAAYPLSVNAFPVAGNDLDSEPEVLADILIQPKP